MKTKNQWMDIRPILGSFVKYVFYLLKKGLILNVSNWYHHYISCWVTQYCKTNIFEWIISQIVDFIAKILTYFYNTSEFGLYVHVFNSGTKICIIDLIHIVNCDYWFEICCFEIEPDINWNTYKEKLQISSSNYDAINLNKTWMKKCHPPKNIASTKSLYCQVLRLYCRLQYSIVELSIVSMKLKSQFWYHTTIQLNCKWQSYGQFLELLFEAVSKGQWYDKIVLYPSQRQKSFAVTKGEISRHREMQKCRISR